MKTADLATTYGVLLGRRPALEVDELFTVAAHKANTKEVIMPDDKPKKIEFDAEEVSELLDILELTANSPAYAAINAAAVINLAAISYDIQKQLDKRAGIEEPEEGEQPQPKAGYQTQREFAR